MVSAEVVVSVPVVSVTTVVGDEPGLLQRRDPLSERRVLRRRGLRAAAQLHRHPVPVPGAGVPLHP
jgi:hypothetical protein